MMTNTEPERYDYPRPGVKTQKVPNQDDIDKLYKNFTRWDTTLATALIIEGAMRAEEVLQLGKDEVVEKEKSFQISITAGQGKRDIEVVKSPRLTKLMRKTLEQEQEELISLKRRTYRSRLKVARKKAGDQIPEEVKLSHLGLRAAGIHRLIDKGFCIADVEAYTGSENSEFIEKLFEQHRQETFIDNWETDEQETKKYVHANQEDEELDSFSEDYSKLESRIDQVIEEATGGALDSLEELAGNVAKKEPNTCDRCGYGFDEDEWDWESADLDLLEKYPKMAEFTGECPECGKRQELEA